MKMLTYISNDIAISACFVVQIFLFVTIQCYDASLMCIYFLEVFHLHFFIIAVILFNDGICW